MAGLEDLFGTTTGGQPSAAGDPNNALAALIQQIGPEKFGQLMKLVQQGRFTPTVPSRLPVGAPGPPRASGIISQAPGPPPDFTAQNIQNVNVAAMGAARLTKSIQEALAERAKEVKPTGTP